MAVQDAKTSQPVAPVKRKDMSESVQDPQNTEIASDHAALSKNCHID